LNEDPTQLSEMLVKNLKSPMTSTTGGRRPTHLEAIAAVSMPESGGEINGGEAGGSGRNDGGEASGGGGDIGGSETISLTAEQLVQAVTHLLATDPSFFVKIYRAYKDSLTSKMSENSFYAP